VRPIYSQIADGFRNQITSGVLRSDEKLPSVRELAAELSINPNTIQRAYRLLEAEGWIATVPGKGCFVCEVDDQVTRERDLWYTAFDEATTSLLALSITKDQLIARIGKGGNTHA
jgi:GntR family transcriptional regulator